MVCGWIGKLILKEFSKVRRNSWFRIYVIIFQIFSTLINHHSLNSLSFNEILSFCRYLYLPPNFIKWLNDTTEHFLGEFPFVNVIELLLSENKPITKRNEKCENNLQSIHNLIIIIFSILYWGNWLREKNIICKLLSKRNYNVFLLYISLFCIK